MPAHFFHVLSILPQLGSPCYSLASPSHGSKSEMRGRPFSAEEDEVIQAVLKFYLALGYSARRTWPPDKARLCPVLLLLH